MTSVLRSGWDALRRHWLALALLAFFAFFLVYPLLYVIPNAAQDRQGWTLFYFLSLFTNDFLWGCLFNSLAIGFLSTAAATLISLPLAYWFTRKRFRGQTLLASLLLVPLILPPFVGALGLERLFNPFGTFNLFLMNLGLLDPARPIDWLGKAGLLGVVLLVALHVYPIMYLNIAASLANVDPSLEEAARNLGATEGRIFRTVTFPLMLPGFFAGAAIVFVWAFTDLGTPLVFNYSQVVPVQIFNQISDPQNNPVGYALVVVTLLITAALFYATRWFVSRGSFTMMSKGGVGANVQTATRRQTLGIYVCVLALTFAAVLPHIGVILTASSDQWGMTPLPRSFSAESFRLLQHEPAAYHSILNSLKYSFASTFLDLILGVVIAYLVVRRPSWLTSMLDGLAMLPLALPGLVLAFGYLTCYNRLNLGCLEIWLNPGKNPTLLLIVAYTVRRLPYLTRAAMAGLQQIAPVMEEAAENLGAGRWRVMRTVTLPLLAANLAAGAILTFAFALLEVSDSLMLAQQEKYFPITRAIFGFWLRPDDGPYIASAMGVIGMGILALSLVAASVVLGRKMGELFRA
jgi:iron(III) transport system permease protein